MKQGVLNMRSNIKLGLGLFLLFTVFASNLLLLPPVSAEDSPSHDTTLTENQAQIGPITATPSTIDYGLLLPDNSYTQSIEIKNTSDQAISLNLSLIPTDIATLPSERSQITEWISFVATDNPLNISPQGSATIKLRAKIPTDALGGGQYSALLISIDAGTNLSIPISAIISGDDLSYNSSVAKRDLSPWFFKNPITASTTIENQGNVDFDSTAEFTVKNPFTGETLYSSTTTTPILPGASQTISQSWDSAPSFALLSLSQSVTYYDSTGQAFSSQFSRLVVVCPLWLLIVVAVGILIIIVAIIFIVRHRRKKAQKSQAQNPKSQNPLPTN